MVPVTDNELDAPIGAIIGNWVRRKDTWEPIMLTRVVRINALSNNFDVYIGRAGKGYDGYWGNSASKPDMSRTQAVRAFERLFYDVWLKDPERVRRLRELDGKLLGCFCRPNSCHGDVIAHYINNHLGPSR